MTKLTVVKLRASSRRETVSKLIKIAAILGIAALVIAAKQLSSLGTDGAVPALSATTATSISPAELTRGVGPLAETQIDSLY